jgi:protein-disulfide isomerase
MMIIPLISFILLSLLSVSGHAAPRPPNPALCVPETATIIAVIDQQPLTIEDIEDKQINELRQALFEQLERKLKIEALRQLEEKYPRYTIPTDPAISDQAVADFYRQNQLQSRGSLAALAPQIRAFLVMQARTRSIDERYQTAVRQGLIVPCLSAPNHYLIKAPVETAYLRGNPEAAVMVLEFSDYECPFCSRVQETLSRLRLKYGSKVVFGYRHSPLSFHQKADSAAIAAECARDQGKFEPYHDLLFQYYRNLAIEELKKYARTAGIADLTTFNDCLDSEKYRERLENDQAAAQETGIQGTPAFVIGRYDRSNGLVSGEIISGAQPMSVFESAIDKYLAE